MTLRLSKYNVLEWPGHLNRSVAVEAVVNIAGFIPLGLPLPALLDRVEQFTMCRDYHSGRSLCQPGNRTTPGYSAKARFLTGGPDHEHLWVPRSEPERQWLPSLDDVDQLLMVRFRLFVPHCITILQDVSAHWPL